MHHEVKKWLLNSEQVNIQIQSKSISVGYTNLTGNFQRTNATSDCLLILPFEVVPLCWPCRCTRASWRSFSGRTRRSSTSCRCRPTPSACRWTRPLDEANFESWENKQKKSFYYKAFIIVYYLTCQLTMK